MKVAMLRVLAATAAMLFATSGARAGAVVTELNIRHATASDDRVHGMAIDRDANVIVTGFGAASSSGAGTLKYFTIKYDSYGRQKWMREYSTGNGSWIGNFSTLALDRDGNAYVALAESYNFGAILKYDPAGNATVLSTGEAVPASWDHGIGLKLDPAGNLYLRAANYLVKYNAAGVFQWRRQFQAYFANWIRDIAVSSAGEVYAAGYGVDGSDRYALPDAVVSKFDANGTQLWSRHYDQGGSESGIALDFTPGGEVLVLAGSGPPNAAVNSTALLSYDAGGNLLRAVAHGYGTSHLPVAMKVGEDGSAAVAAQVDGDIVTARYRPDGSQAWMSRYNGGWGDAPRAIDMDPLGNVVVSGSSEGYPHWSNARFVTLKYDAAGAQQFAKIDVYGTAGFARFGPTGEIYVAGDTYYPFDALALRYREFNGVCP